MKKIISHILITFLIFGQSPFVLAQNVVSKKSAAPLNLDNIEKAFYEQKAMKRLGVEDTSFMRQISPLQKEALINREKDYDRFYNLLNTVQKAQDNQDAAQYTGAIEELNSLAYKYYLSQDTSSEIPSLSVAILNANLAQGLISDELRAKIAEELNNHFVNITICRGEGCALESARALTLVLTNKKFSRDNTTLTLEFSDLISKPDQEGMSHLNVFKNTARRNFGTLEEDTVLKLGLLDASLLTAEETGVIATASSIINAQSAACKSGFECEESSLPIAVINRIGTYGDMGLKPLIYFAKSKTSKPAALQANLILGSYYKGQVNAKAVKGALKNFYCNDVKDIKDAQKEQQIANQIYLVYDNLGGDNVFGRDEMDSQGSVTRRYYTIDANGGQVPYNGCVVKYMPTVNYAKKQANDTKRSVLAFGKFSAMTLSFFSLEVAAPVVGLQFAGEVKSAIKDNRTFDEAGGNIILSGMFGLMLGKPLMGKWVKIAKNPGIKISARTALPLGRAKGKIPRNEIIEVPEEVIELGGRPVQIVKITGKPELPIVTKGPLTPIIRGQGNPSASEDITTLIEKSSLANKAGKKTISPKKFK